MQADTEPLPAGRSARHWTIGMALLAMEQTGSAIAHFRAARDADPRSKYAALSVEQLRA